MSSALGSAMLSPTGARPRIVVPAIRSGLPRSTASSWLSNDFSIDLMAQFGLQHITACWRSSSICERLRQEVCPLGPRCACLELARAARKVFTRGGPTLPSHARGRCARRTRPAVISPAGGSESGFPRSGRRLGRPGRELPGPRRRAPGFSDTCPQAFEPGVEITGRPVLGLTPPRLLTDAVDRRTRPFEQKCVRRFPTRRFPLDPDTPGGTGHFYALAFYLLVTIIECYRYLTVIYVIYHTAYLI